MSESSFTYQYFQLNSGSDEMRVFNSRPGFSGKLAFIPNAPTFYLTAIDTDGYEHLVEIFDDRDAAIAMADANWQTYGVRGLHDQTVSGMPHVYKSYASQDGWAYIRLEGGAGAPRPSKGAVGGYGRADTGRGVLVCHRGLDGRRRVASFRRMQ